MKLIKRKINSEISILIGDGVQYQSDIDADRYSKALNSPSNEIINYSDTAEALEMAVISKRAEINSKREADANKNVTLNSVEYDNNESSRFAVLAAIVNGQIIGNGFTIDWIAVDDSKNTLTLSDLIQLGQSMSAKKEAAIYNANTHKITVKSLKDLKQVKDYDFSD